MEKSGKENNAKGQTTHNQKDIGYWLLVRRWWLLVIGYWLLVKGA